MLFEHYPLTFCAVLHLIEGMREEDHGSARRRRPVDYIGLTKSDLPDSMVRRLVATILGLPPAPTLRKVFETLEIQQVGRHTFSFSDSAETHPNMMPQTTFSPETLRELRAACEFRSVELRSTPEHLLDLAPVARVRPP